MVEMRNRIMRIASAIGMSVETDIDDNMAQRDQGTTVLYKCS
jgi:hypothetical protein